MIIVSVIIIFLVYLILNHIYYLHKTVEGATSRTESSKISDINTKTENNDISMNSLKIFSDTINTRCNDVLYLYGDNKKEGSVENTKEKLKTCLTNCNAVVIPGSMHKPPPKPTGKG